MANKPLTLEEIDPNFKLNKLVDLSDVAFYDVMDEPFEKYGFYCCSREEGYKRLPDDLARKVNSGVAVLYRQTAGGRVRFATDSSYIAIRVRMPSIHQHPHMPLSGSSGFDLFIDDPETGESRFCPSKFYPSPADRDGFSAKADFKTRKLRYFTLYFPNYNEVDEVYIGLQRDAMLQGGARYRDCEPIVFYGSSITQGGCASRPGNAYTHVVSRRLNMDFLNFGFSGNGKAEDNIVDYLCTLSMSIFVSDYDHNAPDAEYLKKTHCKMYQKIRAAHPHIPYIMLSKPDFNYSLNGIAANVARRDVIYETYRYAIGQGDENVYFIDGESLFRGRHEDMCTIDGCHPNDLGFAYMSDAVSETIRRIQMQEKLYKKR